MNNNILKLNVNNSKNKFINLNKYIYIKKSNNSYNDNYNIVKNIYLYKYNNIIIKCKKSNSNLLYNIINKKKVINIYINILLQKKLDFNYIINANIKYKNSNNKNIYNLYLNFKKNRFFPYFYMNILKKTIFNNSLGIISKYFSIKKSFLKSKNSYIMSSSYLRRLLIYISPKRLNLNIRKTPKYLKDILTIITTNTNVLYQHPFHNTIINEKEKDISIYFEYINFVNNKALGPIKKKKRGRLKRKISKKVTLYNNVLD